MANRASIEVLPSIINAVILTSASSSANAFLYTGSRYMFGIAQNGHAPKFLLKCSKGGVPYWCVIITASISLITYMSATASATTVFNWFSFLTTVAQLFTWCSICICFIRFRKGLIYHGVDRNTLVFKSPFQPYTAYGALIFFSIIIIFNGWKVFTKGNWTVEDFLISYIGCGIFFVLYVGFKLIMRTKVVPIAEMDIFTGKAALDAQVWPERIPRNFLEKVWFWLA
jgi:amino acid transporter